VGFVPFRHILQLTPSTHNGRTKQLGEFGMCLGPSAALVQSFHSGGRPLEADQANNRVLKAVYDHGINRGFEGHGLDKDVLA